MTAEEAELPTLHPLKEIIRRASDCLAHAEREIDGTEHPAIADLARTCKHLLTAIEELTRHKQG